MANLEDLKNTWQSQSGISKERFEQIGSKIGDSTNLLQKVIFRRDMVETSASVLVVAVVCYLMFIAKSWIDWTGYAIVVVAGITIPIVLWWARMRSIATVSAANFRDFVDIEISYLRRQILVLRMVAFWYILPIYVGTVLITIGLTGPRYTLPELVVLTACLVVVAFFCIFMWWLNQQARKTHLEPLLDYYVQMQAALDSGDDSVTELVDPPSAFLQPRPRKRMSNRQWWTWIGVTVVATAVTVGTGFATIYYFDARAGKFIASTAPVVAILIIAVSGLWRGKEPH